MSASYAVDKHQVEKQFNRASASYNQAADIQKYVIDSLLEKLLGMQIAAGTIVDLGCGTGLGLSALRAAFPKAALFGVDIAQSMLDQSRLDCPDATQIKADVEQLPLQNQCVDMAFSSSTLQWCDLDASVRECARILNIDGYLALAMFGAGTHAEWQAAWAETDQVGHTLQYPQDNDICACIEKSGFEIVSAWEDTTSVSFETSEAALRSIKDIGATNANAYRQRGLMGRERFDRFLRAFERISPQHKLSYRMMYFIAKKSATP